MDELTHKAALQACRMLLRPVASLLLRCGLTWREFAAVARSVFVDVAGADYGFHGQPANASRIATVTGINRKEVSRQQAKLAALAAGLPSRLKDATRVLSGWHQDPEFLDPLGRPRPLVAAGAGASFEELCRRYGGDIPPGAMRNELERVGAVADGSDGLLRVALRYYMPARLDAQWVLNAGSMIHDLGTAISRNSTANERQPARFIGRAANDSVDATALPEFRDFVEARGQEFLESVDDWLTAHTVRAAIVEPDAGKCLRLGLGVFTIQDD